MAILDIIITLIFCYAAYKGFKNGLIKELAGLIAIIAGVYMALRFSEFLISILSAYESIGAEYLPLISFVTIFILTLIAVHLGSALIDKCIKAVRLQWLNRIAGVCFSLAKALIILGGIIYIIHSINQKVNFIPKSAYEDSILYNICYSFFDFIFPYAKEISLSLI